MSQINTRKRGGKWEYRFEGASVDGKRQQFSKGGFRTKAEALTAGAKAQTEYNESGQRFNASDISVSDYLDQWINLYCRVNVKASTTAAYEKKIRLYIKPHLGAYRLRALTPASLQDFINDKFNEGFSRNTLIVIKSLLTGSLNYAVEPLHYIQYNPALMIRLPSPRAKAKAPTRKKPRRPVTPEEWASIITRFPEGQPAHIPLILAYRCGLRLGEVFGLIWEDVDFGAGTLRIGRQIQMSTTAKKWEFTAPKYESFRTISIDPNTVALLAREKDKQNRARVYYADLYRQTTVIGSRPDGDHVLTSGILTTAEGDPVNLIMRRDDGDFIQPRIMQHVGRIIHGVYKNRSAPISIDWDFHSLRHTHATALVESGVPLAVIQKRLGHAKIEMTEHYTDHVTDTMIDDLRGKLTSLYK